MHQFDGVSTLQALPLAAGLVVATARPHLPGAHFAIRTARVPPDEATQRADVLAFSTYVWNERYSLEVARRARGRWPDSFILFGGPSVPRQPDRAAAFLADHPFIDALALGEGELTFRDLLLALRDGRPMDGVAGLALRGGLTAARPRLADFATTASPYLDGSFDELLAAGAAPTAAIVETNRGCPFECTFCDWGQAIASKVQELPFERLTDELSWIGRRRIPYVYIVDANFGIRRRDMDIVGALGRVRAATGFPQYVFFHLTKNATERHLALVLALREAGIATHLALSAQDFEPRVLLAVKRDNIRLDRALELRRQCHEKGIPTFNELILGLPEQTYDSFAASMVKAVTPYPGDAFHLYLARALENAEMASAADRARYGLETRRVLIASFHHDAHSAHVPELEEIVVATSALPTGDWRRAFRFGYFLAAAHNLRVLDVVLQVAWRAAGADLRGFVESLLARMAAAPPGSAFAAVYAALERHADAILDGQAMVLPAPETGAHLWAVEDAVLVAALAAGPRFFAELEEHVRDVPLLVEAARYQRFVTPLPGDAGARRATFGWDFAAWRDAGGELPARATALRFHPARPAGRDLEEHVLGHLGAVHARAPLGVVSPAPVPQSSDR